MSQTVDGAEGTWGDEAVGLVRAHTGVLWAITVVGFVGGDLVTTAVGLSAGGVVEIGPLAAYVVGEFGLGAMLPLKLLALAVCVGLWRLTPEPHDVGVPLGLAVFGVIVTGWNLYVLSVAYRLSPL